MTYHPSIPLTMSAHRTIWYELHAREWPFKTQPAEAIIWQMGTGMKPNLSQIGMGKEISVSPRMVPGPGDEGRSRHSSRHSFPHTLRLQMLPGRAMKTPAQPCQVMIWSFKGKAFKLCLQFRFLPSGCSTLGHHPTQNKIHKNTEARV